MAKILVVEDEKNLCLLFEQELTEEGHEVIIAHDGKTAIRLAREQKPDLVIMDINLPEKMNGLESMSKILGENKDMPVIINTGYSQYRDNFMSWAAEAYVLKSGDLTPLKNTIREVLEKRRRSDSGSSPESIIA